MSVIKVGARESPLSKVQVQEVLQELRKTHPHIVFELKTLKTTGDQDLKTSLRGLEKTDFFTRELDEQLLNHDCRITIHSAKDLPDPLPKGLKIIALTHGIDDGDSLVLRDGETLETLSPGALIATSSERREAAVLQLRSDFTFTDLRGTIHQRLQQLDTVDGVVLAEAALIRLNLTHLNRIRLPGETPPLQGKLAVLAREEDQEMEELFSCLECRCAASIQG
ncbi:MAG: Porphobilinogen deaminase [Chlamydiae bacterium]|nr:Porphobilinogen deaminase [Chlamydiota bacterium]